MKLTKKLREIGRRIAFYFRREQFDRELDDEMRFHLAMKARARMQNGSESQDAHIDARRQFGNQTRLKERSREMWSFRWIETTAKDLQFTLRMIRKSPVFASVVILSLALAIGANTAIFSFVNAVLLKKLPVKNPDELVLFGWAGGSNTYVLRYSGNIRDDKKTGLSLGSSFSLRMFERMQEQNQTLTDLFAFAPIDNNLTLIIDDQADIARGQFVSGDYYKGLGVAPVKGRTLTNDDDKQGALPVAVITYRYWKERFGLDPNILGKPAFINELPFSIVGISPPGFEGALNIGNTADVSLPLATASQIGRQPTHATEPWNWWLRVMGRLKPGASIEQARANLDGAVRQSAMEGLAEFLARYPDPQLTNAVPPMLTAISGNRGEMFDRQGYSRELYVLLIIVGLVLMIACVNVANMLLARSGARQKEIAVRIALGAGRWRLIRQLLTESLTLAVAGGLAGFILAFWAKDFLVVISPSGGQPLKVDMSLDLRVLGFTTAVSIATGILFGISPAVKATGLDSGPVLNDTAASQGSGRSWLSLGKSLVVIQVALSVILLVGAGLFLRTLRNLRHVDYGFDAQNLLLFEVNPSVSGYKGERLANIYQQIAERIDTIPGVKSTSISGAALLTPDGWGMAMPRVPASKKQPARGSMPTFLPVKNNFLDTMGIPLLFGRGFDARDNANSPKVAIVNQAFVRLLFDDDAPIGEHFQLERSDGPAIFEVVGIAKDSISVDLRSAPTPMAYFPFRQQMEILDRNAVGMTYEVRTIGDPNAVVPAIRDIVRSTDSRIPIVNLKTQTDLIDEVMSNERIFAVLTSALGLLVLILAGLGLYGVMSYNVTRRTREIGIRMALGAGTRNVLGRIMRETIVLVTIGIVFGIATSYALTNLISGAFIGIRENQSMLFGVTPHDPASIAFAAVFLLMVAAFAGFWPARRASRVDPLIAFKYD